MASSLCFLVFLLVGVGAAAGSPDIVIADFEGADYGAWKVEGNAFGDGPAHGTLPGQMEVTGFAGKGLVNSFHGGDDSTGRLISPDFVIERPYMTFLIGGGGWAGETCMNLIVEGKIVRTSTGSNMKPGGSEALEPAGWDVRELAGKKAHIEIVDSRKGGWGHINVDNIIETDRKPILEISNVKHEIHIGKRLLSFPVANGSAKRDVQVIVDGKVVREFNIELADLKPDWMAPLDVSQWRGKTATVVVNKLPEESKALELIQQSDDLIGAADLYREALRPQIHFSAQRGWNNDPNGLVFYNGEYHMFFQHNPYGWGWGNMHWGHAVSKDLVHWRELGEALYPDELGPMFSGSAVVDWKNTSGFGSEGKPPLVLIYTAAGNPSTQCIAYSTDGRTFTKYAGNPVVGNEFSNRDPKVVWDDQIKKWVMVVYKDRPGGHSINILTSPNLREWAMASAVRGGDGEDKYLFECPDLYSLGVDGSESNKKWVLCAANSQYAVGSFDGETFTPEASKLVGYLGQGFYAAQTFSDEPKQRRIQIGWMIAESPGMPFNQCMSLPQILTLRATPDGPRLNYQPLPALVDLRAHTHRSAVSHLQPGDPNPLAGVKGELLEIDASFTLDPQSVVKINVRGVSITYDAARQEVTVDGHAAHAPLRAGKQTLVIYADRTAFEVYASDGFCYVPKPIIPKPDALGVEVSVTGGSATFDKLEAHELKSIWP